MSYLSDLSSNNPSNSKLILSIVKEYVKKGKFTEVNKYDNVSDYSRFQPMSNQIK
jgi:hypothetical protein